MYSVCSLGFAIRSNSYTGRGGLAHRVAACLVCKPVRSRFIWRVGQHSSSLPITLRKRSRRVSSGLCFIAPLWEWHNVTSLQLYWLFFFFRWNVHGCKGVKLLSTSSAGNETLSSTKNEKRTEAKGDIFSTFSPGRLRIMQALQYRRISFRCVGLERTYVPILCSVQNEPPWFRAHYSSTMLFRESLSVETVLSYQAI